VAPARQLELVAGPAQLAERAALRVERHVRADLAEHGRCRIALSGGRTPRELYRALVRNARSAAREQLDWTRVELFFGDERCVPPQHRDSNYALAREHLIEPLGIPAARVHRMQGERADPLSAARAYERELARAFDCKAPARPRFELVLLGLGADGHTASLFPDSAALEERDRWVCATRSVVPPHWRLSLTLPVLCAAQRVLFLVSGAEKAAALAHAVADQTVGVSSPARRVLPLTGELEWIADEAAAAWLNLERPEPSA
jgi:6-phosphogluconolactonase